MKVKFYEAVKVEKEIEIELPIYSKHDVSGDRYSTVIYKRITAKVGGGFTQCEITVCDSSVEIEINENYRFRDAESDYVLGFGDYECDEEEFKDALSLAKKMLSKCSEPF